MDTVIISYFIIVFKQKIHSSVTEETLFDI